MAELIQPDRFGGAQSVYKFVLINSPPSTGTGTEYNLYTVPTNAAAVIRFLNIANIGGGTVGTFTASLYGLYGFGIDEKLGYGGELTSACPAVFASNKQCRITWSTDVSGPYDNTDPVWDHLADVPIPITYLPPSTIVSVIFVGGAGSDAAPYIDFGQLVVELFNPFAIAAPTNEQNQPVYLLPRAF